METGIFYRNRNRFDVALIFEDLDKRGWKPARLAIEAKLADMTVYRFLRNECQTAPVAMKMANALGYKSPRRWMIRRRQEQVA